ncbi:DUF763 domain-containing protein [Candidatus Aerophobetes bacterium]|nr:DUF763 domain-containing protein [Candidatus Aerophobetes bacterium]
MQKTGIADLPLHYGRSPRWLFEKMKILSREIITAIISDRGVDELLRKISDPLWFQAFGCVLGFDWHSSGLTTTVCGAMKEGVKGIEKELGLFIAGGKGKVSLRTPSEIITLSEIARVDPERLVYASKMSAKVDSAALQDGFTLYHHCFIFTSSGRWAVIQQGMNEETGYARRYHWIGEKVKDFVCEPHHAICSDWKGEGLNMVAKESQKARELCTILSKEKPSVIIKELQRITRLKMPKHHTLFLERVRPDRFEKALKEAYNQSPQNFEKLLGIRGVGAKTIRALALISDLVYGAKPSFKDPATYSFAHGGKDGHPYPVDKKTYQESILSLHQALMEAKIGRSEKIKALKRLRTFL